jgi:hypothetical protein
MTATHRCTQHTDFYGYRIPKGTPNRSLSQLLTEGNVNAKILSSPKRREKEEDRIGENQPFRERTLSVQDIVRPDRPEIKYATKGRMHISRTLMIRNFLKFIFHMYSGS